MSYDVVIVGGGPAGLSAALALGRARRRVLLCDAGPRRNARALHLHNFVTRDGSTPDEFRREARAQLETYPNVTVDDRLVEAITGAKDAFQLTVGGAIVESRRVLLSTGMVDLLPPLEGLEALWGHAVAQCPYCHGWEARDRPWGYLARAPHAAHLEPFVLQLQGWTRDVTVFVPPEAPLAPATQAALGAAGVRVETRQVRRLVAREGTLEAVELEDGAQVPCAMLFAHPPQRHVALVERLGPALDDDGFVRVDPLRRETSIPGVFAAGDLTTRMQAAIAAAAAGTQAGAMINLDLALSPRAATPGS